MEEQVKVHIRVRPPSQEEVKSRDFKKCVEITDPQTLKLYYPRDTIRPFHFDTVLDETSTEDQVYDVTARELVDSVMQGYHGTLFVYGQTGTGKTHTMGLLKRVTQKSEGIVPAAIKQIFENSGGGNITLSFLQIYMENIFDLLNPSKKPLILREDSNTGIFVKDLTEVPVSDFLQASNLINAGLTNRIMGSHNANQTSSRSHIVLTFDIENQVDDKIIGSKLTLIDLAGSERVRGTSSTGLRLDEAKFINGSLSALGKVICALASDNPGHIPFRDSKLTRLLQPSLRGKVVMIATVGPSFGCGNETISTLQFASRCKEVVSFPVLYDESVSESSDKIPNSVLEELEELRRREETLNFRIKELEQQSASTFSHSNSEVIYYLFRLLSKLTQTSIKLTQEMHKTRNLIPENDRKIAEEQFVYPIPNYDPISDDVYMQDLSVRLENLSSSQIINKVQFFAKKLVDNLNLLSKVAIDSQHMKSAIRGVPFKHKQEMFEKVSKEANDALKPIENFQQPAFSYEEPSVKLKLNDIINQELVQKSSQNAKLSVKELMRAKRKDIIEIPERTQSLAAQFVPHLSANECQSPSFESQNKYTFETEVAFIEEKRTFTTEIVKKPFLTDEKPEITQRKEAIIKKPLIAHQDLIKPMSPSSSSSKIIQKKRPINTRIDARSKSPNFKHIEEEKNPKPSDIFKSKTPERPRPLLTKKPVSKSPKPVKLPDKKATSDDFLSQLEKELAEVNVNEDELDAWLKNCDIPLP